MVASDLYSKLKKLLIKERGTEIHVDVRFALTVSIAKPFSICAILVTSQLFYNSPKLHRRNKTARLMTSVFAKVP